MDRSSGTGDPGDVTAHPAPEGGRDGVPEGGSASPARQAVRVALLVALVLLAFAGALVSPPQLTLGWAPAIALFTGGMVAVLNPDFPGTAPARRAAVYAATGTLVLVPATAGLGLLGPGPAAVVLALLSAGGSWAVSGLPESALDPSTAAVRRAASVRRSLPDLSLDDLLTEWRRSGQVLESSLSPRARAAVAQLRSLVVDELTRRDPAGVGRWLRSGGDPDEHLTGGAGRSA